MDPFSGNLRNYFGYKDATDYVFKIKILLCLNATF